MFPFFCLLPYKLVFALFRCGMDLILLWYSYKQKIYSLILKTFLLNLLCIHTYIFVYKNKCCVKSAMFTHKPNCMLPFTPFGVFFNFFISLLFRMAYIKYPWNLLYQSFITFKQLIIFESFVLKYFIVRTCYVFYYICSMVLVSCSPIFKNILLWDKILLNHMKIGAMDLEVLL